MAVPVVHSSRKVEEQQLAEQSEGHLDEEKPGHPSPDAPEGRPFGARSFASKRARTAHTARRPERREGEHAQDRDYSAGHDQGVPDFPGPLPGTHHYRDHAVVLPHQPLDVGPAEPYYSKGMAHGVPMEEIHHGGRPTPKPEDRHAYEATRKAIEEETHPKLDPVPVFIVERGAGSRPLKRAALRQVPVPAAGSDPIILVPRNPHRSSVRLLNESSSPVRILYDLATIGGALLPAAMSSYLEIDTEDEICAYVPAAASGSSPASVQESGIATSPAAGATIGNATAALPAGTYTVPWTVVLGGTLAAADEQNIGLYVGGTLVATSINGTNAGVVYGQPAVTVVIPAGGATLAAKAIGTATTGAVYQVSFSATPAGTDQPGGTGPAAVSVIEQYDVAGGT